MKKITSALVAAVWAMGFAIVIGSVFAIKDHNAANAGVEAAKGVGALGVHGGLARGTRGKLGILSKNFANQWRLVLGPFVLIALAQFLNAGYFLLVLLEYPQDYANLVSYLTFVGWIIAGFIFAVSSYQTIWDFKQRPLAARRR